MTKENYVGQYFTIDVDPADPYELSVSECVWQDSDNLLCAVYTNHSFGMQFQRILLIPFSLAGHFNWYATIDEFYEGSIACSDSLREVSITWQDRNEFPSISVLPYLNSDYPWWRHFGFTGNCVAKLSRCFKEYPESGTFLAGFIAEKAARDKARRSNIESIAKLIAEAGLSKDEVAQLIHVHVDYNELPF